MSVRVESILGYVEYTLYDPIPQIQNLLGYVEWAGTPAPIAKTEDSQVNNVFGYVEYVVYTPVEQVHTVFGYVETTYYNPKEIIHNLLGYVEWAGTPAPIAKTEDSQVNSLFAYVEIKEGIERPVLTHMEVFIF